MATTKMLGKEDSPNFFYEITGEGNRVYNDSGIDSDLSRPSSSEYINIKQSNLHIEECSNSVMIVDPGHEEINKSIQKKCDLIIPEPQIIRHKSNSNPFTDEKLSLMNSNIINGKLNQKNHHVADSAILKRYLRYCHTGEIQFTDINDAEKLSIIAQSYKAVNLEKTCDIYISEYIALFQEARKIINMISDSSTPSIKGKDVTYLSPILLKKTPELNINILSVCSEKDALEKVLKWGKELCALNELSVDSTLPHLIGPLLKHINFFTLTFPYFINFLNPHNFKENCNQINVDQVLTDLLTINTKAECLYAGTSSSLNLDESLSQGQQTSFQSKQARINHFLKNELVDTEVNLVQCSSNNGNKRSENLSLFEPIYRREGTEFSIPPPRPKPIEHASIPKVHEEHENISSKLNEIEIPFDETKEIDRGILTIDLISTISIFVAKGSIKVHGIVLHIKKTSNLAADILPVIINIETKNDDFEEIHKKNPSSSFECIFEKPIIISTKNSICIKATVENLQLQRCNICKNSRFCYNDDKKNIIKLTMSSNHAGRDLPYLIKKILYSHV